MAISALTARPGIAQFVKFCIVGTSSFIIDMGLLIFLFEHQHWALISAKTVSFLVAVGNGFFWNRRWTFRARDEEASKQYPKFLLTNVIGLALNLSIMVGALLLATNLGLMQSRHTPSELIRLVLQPGSKQQLNPLAVYAATMAATVVVMIWNFCIAKFWTFKQKVGVVSASPN